MKSLYCRSTFIFVFAVFISGCNKIIEAESPVTSVNSTNVYADDATATAVLTGIYASFSRGGFTTTGITGLSFFAGLSADELTLYSASTNQIQLAYYKNNLSSANTGQVDFWKNIYPLIFVTNAAIEGLSTSTELTPRVKQQLLGEAKFSRAFLYFYLVNMYGDVPLVLTTDYVVSSTMERTSKKAVYESIVADLTEAKPLLADGYVMADGMSLYPNGSAERLRPNKWAAMALLARVYLYTGEYSKAEAEATGVINNTTLFNLPTLDKVFVKNSTEAIWQLQPVLTGQNTQDARTFILPATGPSALFPVYLSNNLVNSFEATDLRRYNKNWVDSVKVGANVYFYPYKYRLKTTTATAIDEYVMVLRLGEQYLIRAEARAQQENITGAKNELNMIRTRANLPNTTANDKNSLLAAILKERQAEFFTEWGHRWFDLKRSVQIDTVMTTAALQKGATWSSSDQLYPVPASEILRNSNLAQNNGY